MNAIGKTSLNIKNCCRANCRRIPDVALQIMLYREVQRYLSVQRVASCAHMDDTKGQGTVIWKGTSRGLTDSLSFYVYSLYPPSITIGYIT